MVVRLDAGLRRWLLRDSDPSVRSRVLTSLLERPASDPAVRAARRQIGKVGWVARILDEQLPSGAWVSPVVEGRRFYAPKYIATNWRLIVLAELGASGRDPRVRRAVELFLRAFDGPDGGDFSGASAEACFTGNAVRLLAAFGRLGDRRARAAVDWLLRTQKADGGWHCFPSRRGTLDAWEPLAALAAIPPARRSPAVERAVARGAEFFLARGALREGPGTYRPWLRLHYPNHYYYDLLVGLGLLARLGHARDRRLAPALERLERLRRPDGRWAIDAVHPDVEGDDYVPRTPIYPFVLELPGRPSRWVTTSALEVLAAAGRG